MIQHCRWVISLFLFLLKCRLASLHQFLVVFLFSILHARLFCFHLSKQLIFQLIDVFGTLTSDSIQWRCLICWMRKGIHLSSTVIKYSLKNDIFCTKIVISKSRLRKKDQNASLPSRIREFRIRFQGRWHHLTEQGINGYNHC